MFGKEQTSEDAYDKCRKGQELFGACVIAKDLGDGWQLYVPERRYPR
jgi:hypothetical protein